MFFYDLNQLIIHLPCWAAFPRLSWRFDRSDFSNAHFSVFCFISGLLAYISFLPVMFGMCVNLTASLLCIVTIYFEELYGV